MRLALLILMALTLGARGADLTPAFEAANKLYEEGRYPDAIAAYDKLLETGKGSAALYFNRGNAFLKLGQLGRAIASYRSARQFAPRDTDLRANLQLARSQARGGTPYHLPRWRAWLGMLTLNEWTLLFALAVWMLFVLLALTQWRRGLSDSLRKYKYAVGAAAFCIGICFVLALNLDYLSKTAIVTAGEAEVRNGPLEESPALYKVRDGIELTILDQLGEWLQVVDSANRIGWLRQNQVLIFEPVTNRRDKS